MAPPTLYGDWTAKVRGERGRENACERTGRCREGTACVEVRLHEANKTEASIFAAPDHVPGDVAADHENSAAAQTTRPGRCAAVGRSAAWQAGDVSAGCHTVMLRAAHRRDVLRRSVRGVAAEWPRSGRGVAGGKMHAPDRPGRDYSATRF